jgi:protein involved in polysaccharide export with SLBB domain
MQENIQMVGLVKYPGLYPRLDKYERLSSYIERAGGIVDNANIGGALLYRKKAEFLRDKIVNKPKTDTANEAKENLQLVQGLDEPVSIDLYNAMKMKNSKHDLILQKDDIIYVPEINPFVTVKGKVQSPLKITFDKDNGNLRNYIDKAGGFSTRPWRKRIYVTYANGKSKRTKNLFFMHFYPKVEEGCTITVPERPEGKDISNSFVQAISTAVPLVIAYLVLKIK